jgi:hypothetical protein
MSRFAGCVAVLVAAAALATTGAAASSPPKSALLFDPLAGSIGGVSVHDPMSKLVRLLGAPDRVVRLPSGLPVSFWLRGKALCTAWAEAYPYDSRTRQLARLWYRGPLASRRGDRLGTPVSVVRKRWRGSWQYISVISGAPGSNYGHIARFGSATFGFDDQGRLAGAAIDGSQQIWQPIVMPPCP